MKVLIYGSNGWIGSQFREILSKENITFVEGSSRVDDVEKLHQEIGKVQPTHIVSFIGRTHGSIGSQQFTTIDYLEQEGKLVENVRDNLFSPLTLAHIAKEKNIHYSYLGTGCIFSYDERRPLGGDIGFQESSLPNFFGSSYSIVKGFTDRLMKQYDDHVLNIRIRMPIVDHHHPRNFITKIVKYDKICSIPNSMTVLPELLPLVVDMMKNNRTGTVNLTNPGVISHNEILEMYRDIVDPSFTWKNFTQEEQRKILASDRSNNYLETTTLQKWYPEVSPIKKAVSKCLQKYSMDRK